MTVSGSGNVAIYAIEKAQQLGAEVLACSDSSGYLVDEQGVEVGLLKQVKEVQRQRLDAYTVARPDATFVPRRSVREVPCEVALPCATQNEISGEDAARLVKNGCIAVGEGANTPTTPQGVRVFLEAGVAFAPGKAANAASPRPGWRCSRTRRETRGPSRRVSAASRRSCATFTICALPRLRRTASRATTSSARTCS